jgi:aminoglycoside 3-N-acetyltransferase
MTDKAPASATLVTYYRKARWQISVVRQAGLRTVSHRASRIRAICFQRISPTELKRTLLSILAGNPRVLMVHSSLSACGHFTQGAVGVLRTMRELCGTLCLPAHSYCYPNGQNEARFVFNSRESKSMVGVMSDRFWRQPEVVRSIHATHSVAALGPDANQLCADHYLADSPCGAATPFERLITLRAAVLMFGVTFRHYTLFHTAETLAGSDAAFEPGIIDKLRVIDPVGSERVCLSRRQSRAPTRYEEAGLLLEREGLVRRFQLGKGELLFAQDCSEVHGFVLERLKKYPDFLRPWSSAALL